MNDNRKRTTVERRKKILDLISEDGQVYVNELSSTFEVSKVTIRKDLEQLESKNMLLRARGGAMLTGKQVAVDMRINEKSKLNHIEKARIGKAAAKLIRESETIILDSGSTTLEVARNLESFESINVISSAINIVNQLISSQGVKLIVLGGSLRKESHSLVGPMTEKNLRNFSVDKVFIGVDGFDSSRGIFTPNLEEASVNQTMLEIAKEVIIVADSSKFRRKSLVFICPLSEIDVVVTDDKIDRQDLRNLQDKGIKVILA